MEPKLTKGALDFFNACDLAKSMTGKTPEAGTQCWIFNMDDSGRVHRKCEKCPYMAEFQKTEAIRCEEKPAYALISLPEELTEKRLPEFKKIIDGLLAKNSKVLLLDCAALQQMSTPVLGIILRTFKILKEKQGELYLLNPTDTFTALLRSTMLIKILPFATSPEEVENRLRQRDEEVKSGEARRKEEEKIKLKQEAETLRCWDFWKGHHPKNATPCAICHYKASGSSRPCWVVVGEIEGLTFEYINEDCLDCQYYIKLNPEGDVEEIR